MAIIKSFRIKTFKKKVNKISLKNISLSFNKLNVLEDVSFDIHQSSITGLLGPNGSGKSTLFNIICGILSPNYGDVIINGINVNKIPVFERVQKYGISLIPQTGGTFSGLSCIENLKAISEIVIEKKNERNYKIEEMISKFQLEPHAHTKCSELSGGSKKKVAIAMALMSNPSILLMDEPFAFLDILTVRDLQETIVNLQTEDSSRCIIISDHSARELLGISDRALVLANKKIVAQGSPREVIDSPSAKIYFGDSFKIN